MVQIEKQTKLDKSLTIFTVTGETTAEDIGSELERFYAGTPTMNVLWDLSDASLRTMELVGLRSLVEKAKSLATVRPGGRTAIIVSSDFSYGMTRMYENVANVSGHTITHGIFRTREEALTWLSEDTNE